MQQLVMKDLTLQAKPHARSSFLIERFDIPQSSYRKIVIDLLPTCQGIELDCLLIYDPLSNIRAQYRHVKGQKHIVIGLAEIESSTGTVPGPLHEGEWVLVMRSHSETLDQPCTYRYEISVIEKQTILTHED